LYCVILSFRSWQDFYFKKILQKDKKISLSISCTTRPKRIGEINKKDYIFISEDEFKKKIKIIVF
jgi:guanylate kinase